MIRGRSVSEQVRAPLVAQLALIRFHATGVRVQTFGALLVLGVLLCWTVL